MRQHDADNQRPSTRSRRGEQKSCIVLQASTRIPDPQTYPTHGCSNKDSRVHHGSPQHCFLMNAEISSESEKNTDARSPIIPAGRIAGCPRTGPVSLESVLKRRLASQYGRVAPSCVVTK